MKNKNKYRIWVRWGQPSSQREMYGSPRNANMYEFDTEAERDAFALALSEHEGWLESTSFNSEEELMEEPDAWDEV